MAVVHHQTIRADVEVVDTLLDLHDVRACRVDARHRRRPIVLELG